MRSYSIITTPANDMTEKIHTTKKRMPLIFSKEEEGGWLDEGLDREGINELTKPLEAEQMQAHAVSKKVGMFAKGEDRPEVQELCAYEDVQVYFN